MPDPSESPHIPAVSTPGDTHQLHQKRTFALYGNPILAAELVGEVWPHLAGQVQSVLVMSPSGYLPPEMAAEVVVRLPERRLDLVHVMADSEDNMLFLLALEAQSTRMAPHRLAEYREILSAMGDRSVALRDAQGHALLVYSLVLYTGRETQMAVLYDTPFHNFDRPEAPHRPPVPMVRVRDPQYDNPTPEPYAFHRAFIALERLRQELEAARSPADAAAVAPVPRLTAIGAALVPVWQRWQASPHFPALQQGMTHYLALAFQRVFPVWYEVWHNVLVAHGLIEGPDAIMVLTAELSEVVAYQKQKSLEQGRKLGLEQGLEQAGATYRDNVQNLVQHLWGDDVAVVWAARAASYPLARVVELYPSFNALMDLYEAGTLPYDALPFYPAPDTGATSARSG